MPSILKIWILLDWRAIVVYPEGQWIQRTLKTAFYFLNCGVDKKLKKTYLVCLQLFKQNATNFSTKPNSPFLLQTQLPLSLKLPKNRTNDKRLEGFTTHRCSVGGAKIWNSLYSKLSLEASSPHSPFPWRGINDVDFHSAATRAESLILFGVFRVKVGGGEIFHPTLEIVIVLDRLLFVGLFSLFYSQNKLLTSMEHFLDHIWVYVCVGSWEFFPAKSVMWNVECKL